MADISTFTVTFLVEAKGLDVYGEAGSSMGEEVNNLGPPHHYIRLSYKLYPNVAYDVDILIWPHYAKIWHQTAFAWVRTWLQEGRTWFAFTLRHALRAETPVVRGHLITLTVSEGSSAMGPQAKNDKSFEVHCPTSAKLEPPQFAEVIQYSEMYSNETFIRQLVWGLIVNHIPVSHLDGIFDVPQRVTDVRHRDAVIGAVNKEVSVSKLPSPEVSLRSMASKQNHRSKRRLTDKPSAKVQAEPKGFEIHFTGDAVLAGAGRVTKGEVRGARGTEQGAVAMLLSFCNLPAVKQQPVFFVNPLKLRDMPVAALKSAGFSQLYIRWKVLDFEYSSPPYPVSTNIWIGNPQSIPLERHRAAQLLAFFQEKFLEVEIRGLRTHIPDRKTAIIFGTSPSDSVFGINGISPPKIPSKEMDALVAICRIDLQTLSHGNAVIKESFPVFPSPSSLLDPPENPPCTNVINAIRTKKSPEQEISTSVILNAAPTLTLSVGYIGCRPIPIGGGFGRLFCAPNNVEATSNIDPFGNNCSKSQNATLQERQKTKISTHFSIVFSLFL